MIKFSIIKKLGDFTLDVNGQFQEGIIGIYGESGSGKTTFLNCLNGFLKPDYGDIQIKDTFHYSSRERINVPVEKRGTSMVFQDSLLFPHMSVKENIYYGRPKEFKAKYAKDVIDILNLYKLIDRIPETLSGGERQRVAIARTLIHEPELILMDEPVCSLDLKSRYQILAYIKSLHQVLRIPIVYVTHSVSELMYLANTVYCLENGKKKQEGQPMDILLKEDISWGKVEDDVENIFDLPVLEMSKTKNIVLKLGENVLHISASIHQIRPRVRVGIRAKDIIVSRKKVSSISARNILPAEVERVIFNQETCFLSTNVGGYLCLVEITPQAFDELKIEKGQKIYLIMKSRSFVVLD